MSHSSMHPWGREVARAMAGTSWHLRPASPTRPGGPSMHAVIVSNRPGLSGSVCRPVDIEILLDRRDARVPQLHRADVPEVTDVPPN